MNLEDIFLGKGWDQYNFVHDVHWYLLVQYSPVTTPLLSVIVKWHCITWNGAHATEEAAINRVILVGNSRLSLIFVQVLNVPNQKWMAATCKLQRFSQCGVVVLWWYPIFKLQAVGRSLFSPQLPAIQYYSWLLITNNSTGICCITQGNHYKA